MVGGIMSDVFYEMSNVTIKSAINYNIVLQIFLISSNGSNTI